MFPQLIDSSVPNLSQLFMCSVTLVANSAPREHKIVVVAEDKRNLGPSVKNHHKISHPQHMPFSRHIRIYHLVIEIEVPLLLDSFSEGLGDY